MAEKTIQVLLNINAGTDADAEEKEKITRQLRKELIGNGLDAVGLVSTDKAPSKAKGIPDWGTLLLTLVASGGVITTLINTLQSWISLHSQRSVTIEISGKKLEVKGALTQEDKRWVYDMVNTFQK